MNDIQTWQQGRFILSEHDVRRNDFREDQIDVIDELERLKVKSHQSNLEICRCANSNDAKWIASRLNLASKLEQLSYDFAVGRSDGVELRRFVIDLIHR